MSARRFTAAVAASFLGCLAATAEAAAPAWLQQAASAPISSRSAATVLIDHVDVTVATDGRTRTSRRFAVRINDLAGRDAALVREVYIPGMGRVRDVRGWLIRRGGTVQDVGNDRSVDAALVNNDVYNEVRVRALDAIDEVAAGDVFGVEIESEERLLYAQFEWPLQNEWPVLLARRTLTLPAGWRARTVTFNASPIEARTQGLTTTWEVSNLPEIPDEPGMPPTSSLAPRLVASIFGANGVEPPGEFETWQDAARWLDALSPANGASADAVAAKARALTADTATELDKITAIGRYVQGVQYVSIQTGLGRGGGYQPRPPALVIERNYGDCKDKASLMRALLAASGIRAYMVSIFSGDRAYVRAEWPSPQQFNHAIVAIAVADSTARGAASIIEHPTLGRLLVFDPTDPFTPVGELPETEQGSLALIVSPTTERLERMPMSPKGHDRLVRVIDGSLDASGALVARMTERSRGIRAAAERAAATLMDATRYRDAIQRQVSASIPAARVATIATESVAATTEFVVTLDLTADAFAQTMGSLLLVKPPFGMGDPVQLPSAAARRTPIVVEARSVDETLRIQLPTTFKVDEVPTAATIETDFGRYSLSYTNEQDHLVAHRVLEVPEQIISVSDYRALLDFLTRIRAADTAAVVLAK